MKLISFLRSLIVVLVLFPLVTFCLGLSGVIVTLITGRRNFIQKNVMIWAKSTLFLFNVHIVERGRENLSESGCLYLFNHTSFMDIFVIAAHIEKVSFGAKEELFRIPIFSQSMKAAGMLPISRGNKEKVIKVYKEAEERARMGEQFALSPEGSRNFEEKLLPFKRGPFIFAINSGIPIAPVVIKGASKVWPKGALVPAYRNWSHTIEVLYLPRVSVDGLSVNDREMLSEKVRQQMLPYFS